MVFFLSRIFWSALLPVSVGQCQWQTSGNSYEFSCAWRLWGYSSHTPVSTETWWPGESQKQIWIICIPVPKCSFLWAFLSWCEAACAGKEKSAGGSGADGCHQFTAALQFWHQLRVSMWQHQVWQSEWLLCPSKFSCLVISSSQLPQGETEGRRDEVHSHRGIKLGLGLVEEHLETDPDYWLFLSRKETGMLQ